MQNFTYQTDTVIKQISGDYSRVHINDTIGRKLTYYEFLLLLHIHNIYVSKIKSNQK